MGTKLKTYTAFCRDTDDQGTLWIDTVRASNRAEAVSKAVHSCASDWECSSDNVKCVGLARDDVDLIFWDSDV